LVKIRLKRMGTTKRPFYRLVVADSRSPRDGRFIEALGFYDPLPVPASVQIDAERVREWLRKGARPSDSARDLLVAQGILPANSRRSHAAATEVVETPEVSDAPSAVAAPPAAEAAPEVAVEPAALTTEETAAAAEAIEETGK
jgi:small subunit ribosomal protein S16